MRPVVSLYLLAQAFMTFEDKLLLDTLVATVLTANPDLAHTLDTPTLQSPSDADQPAAPDLTALGESAPQSSSQVTVYGEAFFLAVLDLMSCAESDYTALPAVCMLQAMMENSG